MVNGTPETECLGALQGSVVRHSLTVNELLPDAAPSSGAVVPTPGIGSATKRFWISEAMDMDWMRQWVENWSVFAPVNSIAHVVVLMQYRVHYLLGRTFDKVSVAAALVSVSLDAQIMT